MEIVAHQVQHRAQQCMPRMVLRKIAFKRMDPCFGRWHGEDQPTLAGVDRAKAQHIPKKGAVGLRIFAVQQEMSAKDHGAEYIGVEAAGFDQFLGRS